MAAVLGDDGRYHLLRGEVVLCTQIGARPSNRAGRNGGEVPHRRDCRWWTDGATYRLYPPRSLPLEQQVTSPECIRRVEWTVQLLDNRADPAAVPSQRRCTYSGSRSDWPPHRTERTALGRIRTALIQHGGSRCHACGLRTGVIVDHDHFTGTVRGLLCSHRLKLTPRCTARLTWGFVMPITDLM